ncbi:MAG: hypothetical protein COA78_03855 [Blastopirellula sp.]|nr:MAG: hypothetical protein COA78_03855 [Blastopirellula sp.]
MKWLLWREKKLNRLILMTGIVLLVFPYASAILIILIEIVKNNTFRFWESMVDCSTFSLVLSLLTMALLGGNAFAGERTDRSAEFIAYLPLKRTQLFASKLYLILITLTVIWSSNLLVLFCGKLSGIVLEKNLPTLLLFIAVTGLVIYGVSWLISSIQSSPTLAIGGGLVVPFIIGGTLTLIVQNMQNVEWFRTEEMRMFIGACYVCICAVLGTVGFGLGTAYYLQRKEP